MIDFPKYPISQGQHDELVVKLIKVLVGAPISQAEGLLDKAALIIKASSTVTLDPRLCDLIKTDDWFEIKASAKAHDKARKAFFEELKRESEQRHVQSSSQGEQT